MILALSYQLRSKPFWGRIRGKRMLVLPLLCSFKTGFRPVCPCCGKPLIRHGTYTKICDGRLPKRLELQIKPLISQRKWNRKPIETAILLQRWRCETCRYHSKMQSTHVELPDFLLGYLRRTRTKFVEDLETSICENGGMEALLDEKRSEIKGKEYILDAFGYFYWRFLEYFRTADGGNPTSYFLFLQKKFCYHPFMQ